MEKDCHVFLSGQKKSQTLLAFTLPIKRVFVFSNKFIFLLSKDALNWLKLTVKTSIMSQKIYISKSTINIEMYHSFHKILSNTTVFNIDDKIIFYEHIISILKLFLRDHVTLKTGVMATTEINYIIQTRFQKVGTLYKLWIKRNAIIYKSHKLIFYSQ